MSWRWLPLLALLVGCTPDEPDLERMLAQRRVDPYEASVHLPGGQAMQWPPEGTVPFRRSPTDPRFADGLVDGEFAPALPVPVDAELLLAGRQRFETLCAVCHGPLGTGDSEPARFMILVKPPSLVHPPVRGMPPGRIFVVITSGYGLMPSYAEQLDPAARWAVVAFVDALQLAAAVEVTWLPPALRARLEEVPR